MRSHHSKTNLQWTSEQQKENEWEYATLALSGEPAGTKLKRSADGIKTNFQLPETNDIHILEHSYLVVENKILALNEKGAYLGKGNFAKVKLAEDREGKRYAVKIETQGTAFRQQEAAISKDLQFALENCERDTPEGDKYYLATTYLGESLYSFLEKKGSTLTRDQQYDLAIKVSLAVTALHQGVNSSTKTKYAHLDLKPENITIDDQGDVHLVDYEFSALLDGRAQFARGTPLYLAKESSCQEKTSLDIYALLRTLFLPKIFQTIKGKLQRTVEDPIIFSEKLVENESKLKGFLHTRHGEISQRVANYEAIDIVANLILLKNGLMTDSNKQAMKNSQLRAEVINAHLSGNSVIQAELKTGLVDVARWQRNLIRDSESEMIGTICNARFKQVEACLDALEVYRKKSLNQSNSTGKNFAVTEFITEIRNKISRCIQAQSVLEFGSVFYKQAGNLKLFSTRRSPTLPILFSILGALSVVGLIVGLCQYFVFTDRKQFLLFKSKPDTVTLSDKVKEAIHQVAPCAK